MKSFKLQDSGFKTNGFTFVEIAMVVGILALLSSIVIVNLNIRGNKSNANNIKRRTDLESIQGALDLRAQETGDSLPSGLLSGLSERCVGTGSDVYNLNSLNWTESADDPDIKFDVRPCDDAGCVGETWPGTPSFSSSPAALNITNAPYFQYKATFNAPELAWTQDTDANFNGTNASTVVSGAGNDAIAKLHMLEFTTGSVPTLDLSLGSSSCAGTNLSWSGSTCTITSNTTKNSFEFELINIPLNTTLKINGDTKLSLKSRNSVTINGTVNLNGTVGSSWSTVTGYDNNANNGGGGRGGLYGSTGEGKGPGGVGGGIVTKGGGFGGAGGGGGGASYPSPYNNNSDLFYGGSGGGGGNNVTGSGAGGGGGGGVRIISGSDITIGTTGSIYAEGGVGGQGKSTGAGGAGGGVLLQAKSSVSNQGNIYARGGAGGFYNGWAMNCGGGGGRVRIETATGSNITSGNIVVTGGADGGLSGCAGDGSTGTNTSGALSSPNLPNLTYSSSGNYTSSIFDTTNLGGSVFTSIAWTPTTNIPGDGEITLEDANLKGLWHLNETAGTNVPDSVGTNSGTIPASPNNPSWNSSGKFGYSLLFGVDDYVTIVDNNALDIGTGTEWSVGSWINLLGSGTRTIISKNDLYDMAINGSGQLTASIYDPTDTDQIFAQSANPIPTDGQFHYVVFVFKKNRGDNNAEVKLYIDGKYDGSATVPTAAFASDLSNANNLIIGAGTNGFDGRIDEISLWSKALTVPANDCATDDSYYSQYDICKQYNNASGLPHLKFQARSCNDLNCDTEVFVGPDGATSTYYNSKGSYGSGSVLSLPDNQYVQYKAYFTTSTYSSTPSLDSISVRYLSTAKPQLLDATITGTSAAFGNSGNFTHTTYNNFIGGIFSASEFTIRDSANPSDSVSGLVEYKGGTNVNYTSSVFSGVCYNLTTDLAPLYLGTIPKDPKTGTDENTGYLISVDSATKVVCVKAPGAENDEIIENCRK